MNEYIANIFKCCRKYNDLQQVDMAKILEVTQGTISKIETGSVGIELELWFRFLVKFSVKDPYCFKYNSLEFVDLNYSYFNENQNPLLPNFSFTKKSLYIEVRFIRPLFEFLQIHKSNEFLEFLRLNGIKKEVFYILNHPLPIELVNLFFEFLELNRITSKIMVMIPFSFQQTFGEIIENGKTFNFQSGIETYNLSSNFINYTFNNEKNYKVTIASDLIKNNYIEEALISYLTILPLLFLKNSIDSKREIQDKSLIKENSWNLILN